MRIVPILLSILILSGCVVKNSILFKDESAVGKPDLIINGSFEESLNKDDNYTTPWLVMAKDKSIEVLKIDTNHSAEGSNSLLIEPTGQRKLIVSESFSIDKNAGYYVKAFVKSTNANKTTVKMEFRSYNKKGELKDKFTVPIKPGDSWEAVEISAGLFKSTAKYGRIIFIIPSYQNEPLWIDNIGCFKVHEFLN